MGSERRRGGIFDLFNRAKETDPVPSPAQTTEAAAAVPAPKELVVDANVQWTQIGDVRVPFPNYAAPAGQEGGLTRFSTGFHDEDQFTLIDSDTRQITTFHASGADNGFYAAQLRPTDAVQEDSTRPDYSSLFVRPTDTESVDEEKKEERLALLSKLLGVTVVNIKAALTDTKDYSYQNSASVRIEGKVDEDYNRQADIGPYTFSGSGLFVLVDRESSTITGMRVLGESGTGFPPTLFLFDEKGNITKIFEQEMDKVNHTVTRNLLPVIELSPAQQVEGDGADA